MPTIHVKEKFSFTNAAGQREDYSVGSHDVADETAANWFVQSHCSGKPIVKMPENVVGALEDLTAERDTLADLLVRTQGQSAELQTAVSALTAERDALSDQVAELQAGGTSASTGKAKK